jgi:hypothetical protein
VNGEIPEACSLSGDDLEDRLTEFRTLLGRAATRRRFRDHLSFRFPLDVEAQLRELAHREQACCGFWVFEMRIADSEIIFDVAVTSPRSSHFIDAFERLATAEQLFSIAPDAGRLIPSWSSRLPE